MTAERDVSSKDWRAEIGRIPVTALEQLAHSVCDQSVQGKMSFWPLKTGHRAICLGAECNGRRFFLKLFDARDASARASFEREKTAYRYFSGSGLVPDLLAYSDPHRMIVLDWAGSDERQDLLSVWSASELGRRLGEWLARFDAVAPWERTCGNWSGYLSRISDGVDLDAVGEARAELSRLPLCGKALTRGDCALHNFLITRSGALVGCDLEFAGMRPRGWDYVQMHHAIIQRYPEQAAEILEHMSEGFARAHKGALLIDELNLLARILFCARAMSGRAAKGEATWQ